MSKIFLNECTNDELINFLKTYDEINISELGGICTEILRRMNNINPILPKEKSDPNLQ